MRELEDSIGEEDSAITPYFENEFEGLCQFLDVAKSHIPPSDPHFVPPPAVVPLVRARSSLLAQRSTKAPYLEKSDSASDCFTKLYRHAALEKPSGPEMVLRGRFHITLLMKL